MLLTFSKKITNKNVIKSISNNQYQILEWIIRLYIPEGRFDYDPTYSKGVFYKTNIPYPKFRSCITDEEEINFVADSQALPFKSEIFNSICFDPPFVISTGPSLKNKKQGSNIISNRFGMFKDIKELFNFYYKSLEEFYRILKQKGVLVFKCQDTVTSTKQCLSHVFIINAAQKVGFYPKDLFILLADNRILSGKIKKQQHARKFHSYFLVFTKEKSKVMYL